MLNLNLLPPNEKLNLSYEFRTRAVLSVGWLLIVILSISAILMLPSLFVLSFQTTEVLRALDLLRQHEERSGMRGELKRIEGINTEAFLVAKNFEMRPNISGAALFADLLQDVPDTILFQRFALKRSVSKVTIDGFASTRTAFLAFLERMRSNPRVTSVQSPVSNVIRDADINFSITLTIRPLQ